MNALLQKAIEEMARLPERDQEALAGLILAELDADENWNARFAQTQHQLGELVRRACEEAQTEGTLPYDPSNRPQK
ncbi:MAG TPA: hypothetical protein VII49_01370 [Rhizomicrobium sp.]